MQAWTIRLPERWLPLHALLCLSIALTLVDDTFLGGLGVFAIWGTLLYIIIHFVVSIVSRESFASVEAPTPTDSLLPSPES